MKTQTHLQGIMSDDLGYALFKDGSALDVLCVPQQERLDSWP